jgi:predicted membrane protein
LGCLPTCLNKPPDFTLPLPSPSVSLRKFKDMTNAQYQSLNYDDYIDTTAIFGEVKKSIISKNFKGGKVTNLFGETKIDLSQAEVYGKAVIDVSQLFGEVKVRVPAGWHVITEVSNILAEVKDKRTNAYVPTDNPKVLVITGVSIFAVVKILDCI